MQLTKAQLSRLHRMAPDVPDQVWFRVHAGMIDDIHRRIMHHSVHRRHHINSRSGGCKTDAINLLWFGSGQSEERRRGGAQSNRGRRSSETSEQQASAIRGAINGSASNQHAIEAQVKSLSVLTAKQKADQLTELRKGHVELTTTSEALKAQAAADHPNASPAALQRAWNAFQSFASILLLAFKNVFSGVFEAFSWFVSDVPQAGEVRKAATNAAVEAAMAKETTWKTKIWKAVKWLGNAIVSGLKAAWSAISFIFPSVFKLVQWIVQNPQTAKMTLIMANFIKKSLCRQIAVWMTGPDSGVTVDIFDPWAMAQELKGPILVKATLAVVKSKAVDEAFDQATDFLTDTLSGIEYIGGFLKAVTKVAVGSIKESARESLLFYAYYANTTASFGLLFDFLDPRPCLVAYSQQANEMRAILESREAKPKSRSRSIKR